MYRELNLNPEHKRVGDCTVRAIAAATMQQWETVYTGLAVEGLLLHDMPTANYVWGRYLRRCGWSRSAMPNQLLGLLHSGRFCGRTPRRHVYSGSCDARGLRPRWGLARHLGQWGRNSPVLLGKEVINSGFWRTLSARVCPGILPYEQRRNAGPAFTVKAGRISATGGTAAIRANYLGSGRRSGEILLMRAREQRFAHGQ